MTEFDEDGNAIDETDPQVVALLQAVARRHEALRSDCSARGVTQRAALAAVAHAAEEALRLRTLQRPAQLDCTLAGSEGE